MNLSVVSGLSLAVLLFSGILVNSAPVVDRFKHKLRYKEPIDDEVQSGTEEGKYFEGDLDISEDLINSRYGKPNKAHVQTAGLPSYSGFYWPEATVYYDIDDSLQEATIANIYNAIELWSDNTCVSFQKRTSQPDYVHITTGKPGCFSDYVGYNGSKQTVNLDETGCTHVGTIAHELGHIMGLWHEQSRPDRDQYIRILMENVNEDDKNNFKKVSEDLVDTKGLPYDYDSVMHYSSKAFSKNGQDTIEVIHSNVFRDEGSPEIGQRDHLSKGDIAIINKMYNCK